MVLVISSGVQNSTLGFETLCFALFCRVLLSSLLRFAAGSCEPPGLNWGGRDMKGNLGEFLKTKKTKIYLTAGCILWISESLEGWQGVVHSYTRFWLWVTAQWFILVVSLLHSTLHSMGYIFWWWSLPKFYQTLILARSRSGNKFVVIWLSPLCDGTKNVDRDWNRNQGQDQKYDGTGTKAGTRNIMEPGPGPRTGTRYGRGPGLGPGPAPGPGTGPWQRTGQGIVIRKNPYNFSFNLKSKQDNKK